MKKIFFLIPLILCGCDSDAKPGNIDRSFTYHVGIVDCGARYQGCANFESMINCEKGVRNSLVSLTQKELDTMDEMIRSKLEFDENAVSQMDAAAKKVGLSYVKCI